MSAAHELVSVDPAHEARVRAWLATATLNDVLGRAMEFDGPAAPGHAVAVVRVQRHAEPFEVRAQIPIADDDEAVKRVLTQRVETFRPTDPPREPAPLPARDREALARAEAKRARKAALRLAARGAR